MTCRRRAPALAHAAWWIIVGANLGCESVSPVRDPAKVAGSLRAQANVCPDRPIASERAPGTLPHHETAGFWLPRLPPPMRQVVLDESDIVTLHQVAKTVAGAVRDVTDEGIGRRPRIDSDLEERRQWLLRRVREGNYVQGRPDTLRRAFARIDESAPVDRLHIVARETPLWCVPTREGLYAPPVDLAFDRNRCASLHTGEAVRALLDHPNQPWTYVHAGHSVGWVFDAALGPALDRRQLDAFHRTDPRIVVTLDRATYLAADEPTSNPAAGSALRLGTSLPLLDTTRTHWTVLAPGVTGLHAVDIPRNDAVVASTRPFRPADVIRTALDHVGQAYGWGGRHGDYDCSRFLHDLFASFGVSLARHSAVQAKLGTRSQDIGELGEAEKRAAILAAATEGIVLLYMPGHIMLYLGEDGDDLFAVSAISEYLEPCRSGQDVVRRLDRVAVTTLEVGRGTARTAFIERLTRLAVFGRAHHGGS